MSIFRLFTLRRSWLLTLLCVLLAAMGARAETLSPDQALQQALASSSSMRKAPAARFQLACTFNQPQSATPAVYVFNTADMRGFLITGAESELPLLLGYSDSGIFDPNNIPPALRATLEKYSRWVSNRPAGQRMAAKSAVMGKSPTFPKGYLTPGAISLQTGANSSAAVSVPVTTAPRRSAESRDAIAPLVATIWNQGPPYNNLCPEIDGSHCVTGCIATAMAQVMKVFNWPPQGKGSVNYSFEYDETSYPIAASLANTYDWDNMLTSYSNGYTTAQGDAVATLMRDAGYAASMVYTPYESGASVADAAMAFVNNFDYDCGLTMESPYWYEDEVWVSMIYEELAQGRPVYITGADSSYSGHAFVCDGYSTDNYFHINWGWGGIADGYFAITDLNPYEQGIGGGSGDSGFNYNQLVLTHIQTPQPDSQVSQRVAWTGPFGTDQTTYSRANGEITFNGALGNYTITSIPDLVVAYKIIWPDQEPQYLRETNLPIEPFSAYGCGAYASTFPVGEYDLQFVWKSGINPEWQPVLASGTSMLHFVVTDSTVTVTENGEESGEDPVVSEKSWRLKSITDKNGTEVTYGSTLKTVDVYTYTFEVTCPDGFTGYIYPVIYSDTDLIIRTYSEIYVNCGAGKTVEFSANLKMPAAEVGDYLLGLFTPSGGTLYSFTDTMYPLTFESGAYFEHVLYINGRDGILYNYENSSNDNVNVVFGGEPLNISADVTARGGDLTSKFQIQIYNSELSEGLIYSKIVETSALDGETQHIEFPEIDLSSLETNKDYLLYIVDEFGKTGPYLLKYSEAPNTVSYTLQSVADSEGNPVDMTTQLKSGHIYNYTFEVTATKDQSLNFWPLLTESDGLSHGSISQDYKNVQLTAGQPATVTFPLRANYDYEGTLYVTLYKYLAGALYNLDGETTAVEFTPGEYLYISSVKFNDNEYYNGETFSLDIRRPVKVEMEVEAKYGDINDTVWMTGRNSNGEEVNITEALAVSLNRGENKTLRFEEFDFSELPVDDEWRLMINSSLYSAGPFYVNQDNSIEVRMYSVEYGQQGYSEDAESPLSLSDDQDEVTMWFYASKGIFDDEVYVRLVKDDDPYILSASQALYLDSDGESTKSLTFRLPLESMQQGVAYRVEACGNNYGLINGKQTYISRGVYTGVDKIEEIGEAAIYDLSGCRVKNPTPGIYIIRRGDKVSKFVVK